MNTNHNVSRETKERLNHFVDLVLKWTPRINLISKSTHSEIWARHIEDSLQLNTYLTDSVGHWADFGSGGGFPAIVIAICAKETGSVNQMTLVESDQRKSTFLRTAIRELDLSASVISERIEQIEPLNADVISARALGDLNLLLEFTEQHLANDGIGLFLKGKTWQKEVRDAQKNWSFDYEQRQSSTSSESVVLKISGVARV